jgi:cell division protein ZapE
MSAETPIAAYRAGLRSGALSRDPMQELAVEKLQLLHQRLSRYDPRPGGWSGLFRRRHNEPPPQGLYLHGSVGRGKTMLMDLFYATVGLERKRRAHFHEFMLEVHERLNAARRRDGENGSNDALLAVADEIAAATWLLCFDEFEVRDVADAMILGRLFTRLFELGVVLVATSNQAPERLYEGGLNRQLFLPFIALLQRRLEVLHLDGAQDYRMLGFIGTPVYHTPLGPESEAALDRAFARLTGQARGEADEISVKGRRIRIAEQARGVARFSFEELCLRPLGPIDYLAIVERYHTIVLSDISRLAGDQRNEARRLISLIDVLYDNHVRLVCSAEVSPDGLYPQGEGALAFQRTASRLVEMQSDEYVSTPRKHGP